MTYNDENANLAKRMLELSGISEVDLCEYLVEQDNLSRFVQGDFRTQMIEKSLYAGVEQAHYEGEIASCGYLGYLANMGVNVENRVNEI